MTRHHAFAAALATAATIAATLAAGCAGRVEGMDLSGVPVRTLGELSQNPSPLEDAMGGDGAAVVKIAAGDRVPLQLRVDTPVFRAEGGDNALVFERDAYLYITKRGALVSPDGERWAAMGDSKALRRLFGMEHGSLQVGFGISRERGPEARVVVEARP
jgi:hypothetical protein